MMNYFISTGCSFTEVPIPDIQNLSQVDLNQYSRYTFSWPVHVVNHLNCTPKYKGKGASGNGIISRTTIHEVIQALKTYKPDEILVGIMWSGAYRQEIYLSEPPENYYHIHPSWEHDENTTNPATIGGNRNFYKVMPYWEDDLSKMYYKNIYDDVAAYMQTIEHILRVQWFLKNHNIKYFMTQYYYLTFPNKPEIMSHPDIQYLYEQIDFDNWLPVKSEYDWCAEFQDPKTWDDIVEFGHFKHPHTLQHKAFVDHVVIPFLKEKRYIN